MEHSDYTTSVKVGLDPVVAAGLDRWRQNCPTINRASLVNQVLFKWLKDEKAWD
jgi:hypothetical protein